jgi:hypothetical protein
MTDALANQPRLLGKMIPSLHDLATTATNSAVIIPLDSNGWERIRYNGYPNVPGIPEQLAAYYTFIDLAGYKQSDLTFVVQGVTWTDSQPCNGITDGLEILDILSTTPYVTTRPNSISDMTVEDNKDLATGMTGPSPGFPDSLMQMEQILYARKRTYYHDTGWSQTNLLQMSGVSTWGEGSAIAGDRIYVTRLVIPSTTNDASAITIPQSVVNVVGQAVEEDDLSYIMRLRRDFELQSSQ